MKKGQNHGLEGLRDDTEGKGYKRTEVGVIPDDWEIYYLYEIAKKITDGEHLTPKRTTEGYYLLSARNIHNGLIDLTDVDFVGIEEYQRIRKRCNPEAGDLLISCSGTIGRVAVLPSEIECVMVRSAALIKLDKTKTNSYFIQYILQSIVGQIQISQSLNQGAQANLFINHIERLKTPFPSLPEQKAIALSLSDTDALIAVCERAITKKRNIKQGAMQQLLTGKKRLPGFSGEWEVKKLEKVAPLQRGFDLPTSQLIKGNYPVVYSNGILNFHNKYQAKAPGVVTGRSGTIGKVNFVETDYWPHNTSLWVTDFKGSYPKFIYYLYVFIGLERFGTGSGVPTLNRNDVHAFQISLPPTEEEQKAIAQILSDIDVEIAALEKKRDKYKAIKQGMMQELLTGKTRLIDR